MTTLPARGGTVVYDNHWRLVLRRGPKGSRMTENDNGGALASSAA
jgi:nitrogen fixation protein